MVDVTELTIKFTYGTIIIFPTLVIVVVSFDPLVSTIKATESQQVLLDRLSSLISFHEGYVELQYGEAVLRLYQNGQIVCPLMQNGVLLGQGVVLNDARNLRENLQLIEVPEDC